jgi:hypothetical protein
MVLGYPGIGSMRGADLERSGETGKENIAGNGGEAAGSQTTSALD